MKATTLQKHAKSRADELPGANLEHPFGPEWEVYKVGGKVFMLLTAITGEPIVILKAAPADGEALRSTHEDITAGYHMNKRHWITLSPGGWWVDRQGPGGRFGDRVVLARGEKPSPHRAASRPGDFWSRSIQ
jgi:predicted DNA-binding protein (MmcQ/YjbR family)